MIIEKGVLIGLILILMGCIATPKSDAYFNALILATGYVENLSDLSSYQKNYLTEIKGRFNELEKEVLSYSITVFDDWYGDQNPISELKISGLNLPSDNSNTWELYVESYGEDKYLVVIVILDQWKIEDYTVVD